MDARLQIRLDSSLKQEAEDILADRGASENWDVFCGRDLQNLEGF